MECGDFSTAFVRASNIRFSTKQNKRARLNNQPGARDFFIQASYCSD